MYIIDRYKDYYDFYSHIYGVDKSIVFDRRNSVKVTDEDLSSFALGNERYISHRDWDFILLEVGMVQYLIKVFNVIRQETSSGLPVFISCEFTILKRYTEDRHLFEAPMSIREVSVHGRFGSINRGLKWMPVTPTLYELERMGNAEYIRSVDSPILADTSLTKLLDPFELWKNLSTYISSLGNDIDVELKMTDVGKAETHGFDKYSFRHPIK